jgi:hypothetical protein
MSASSFAAPLGAAESPLEYQRDAVTLSPSDLRRKYASSYGCWKNMKYERPDKEGAIIQPAFQTFAGFLYHMGPRPGRGRQFSIDRIDNSNPTYGPGLCRWATAKEQSRNRSSTHRVIDPATGETLSLPDWAERHNLNAASVRRWITKDGLSPAQILATKGAGKSSGTKRPAWFTTLAIADAQQLKQFSPIEHLNLTKGEEEAIAKLYGNKQRLNEHLVEFIPRHCKEMIEHWKLGTEDLHHELGELEYMQGPRTVEEIEADLEILNQNEQKVMRIYRAAVPILSVWRSRWVELAEQQAKRRQPRRPYRDPEAAYVDACEGGYLAHED